MFQLVIFTGNGTGWYENSTRWKSCKPGRVRGHGALACLAHALQCLCDGRACCPARALQLVICVFLRSHRHRHPVVSTRNFHWDGTGWCENSTRWKTCKQVHARGGGAWACLAHALQCLCDRRACCPARALQLVICVFLRFHRHRHPVVSTRCFTGRWYGLV